MEILSKDLSAQTTATKKNSPQFPQ